MVTAVPYESVAQVATPELMGQCPQCLCVEPYIGPGMTCPGCEHEEWPHKAVGMVKRRLWGCPTCGFYYRTRVALLNHEHEYV